MPAAPPPGLATEALEALTDDQIKERIKTIKGTVNTLSGHEAFAEYSKQVAAIFEAWKALARSRKPVDQQLIMATSYKERKAKAVENTADSIRELQVVLAEQQRGLARARRRAT